MISLEKVLKKFLFLNEQQEEFDKKKIAKVLKEFKEKKLFTSYGKKVTNYKQALAIALNMARKKKNKNKKKNNK